MASWPTTVKLPTEVNEKTLKAKHKLPFEAGYTQVRGQHLRKRKQFELTWSGDHQALSWIEKDTIETFFDDNNSNAFIWTNPNDGVDYTVYFAEDELNFKRQVYYVDSSNNIHTYWQLKLVLTQA